MIGAVNLCTESGALLLAENGRELLAEFGPRPVADTIFDPFGDPRDCLLVLRWIGGRRRIQVPAGGLLNAMILPGRYAVDYRGWRRKAIWQVPAPSGAPVGLNVIQVALKETWQLMSQEDES